MTHRFVALRVALVLAILIQPFTTSSGVEPVVGRMTRFVKELGYDGVPPVTGQAGSVELLAKNIDWLEHHIDTYGSVVAKQPDIWGEARMTKHRTEYERILYQKLNGFESKLNASMLQSDSAFLAQALALSAAAGTTPPSVGTSQAGATASANSNTIVAPLVGADQIGLLNADGKNVAFDRFTSPSDKIALEPVVELDQLSRYLQHLQEFRRINEGDDTSDSPGYSLNLVRIPVSILPGKLTRTGFGAEVTVQANPVLSDDLLPTTFRNLAVNDVVDMLGLPTVRTTEAWLYGKLDKLIGKELFREEVAPINQVLNNLPDMNVSVATQEKAVADIYPHLEKMLNDEVVRAQILAVVDGLLTLYETPSADKAGATTTLDAKTITEMDVAARKAIGRQVRQYSIDVPAIKASLVEPPSDCLPNIPKTLAEFRDVVEKQDAFCAARYLVCAKFDPRKFLGFKFSQLGSDALAQLNEKAELQSQLVVPTGHARRALDPLAPSDVLPVIGDENLLAIANAFKPKYSGRYIRWAGGEGCSDPELRVDLLDAQRFLQSQTEAAYNLLSQPAHVRLYADIVAPESGLAGQLLSSHTRKRSRDDAEPSVEQYRNFFFRELHNHHQQQVVMEQAYDGQEVYCPGGDAPLSARVAAIETEFTANDSIEALAWAIVVESALLNDRLNQDVLKIAQAKQVYDLQTGRRQLFFLPQSVTNPELGLDDLAAEFQSASQIFQRYVAARWPIHVFAIDPREQDQNVADVSMRKRELQFALALGFVTGQVGASSLTQYSRDLQTQIEAISLNRTIVGFGHGDNTFGWRFQPRVQALPIPGTVGTIRETLCGTSRDYDLNHRQLEPGQRECTALVLMPSFVPYCDFDVRTNWYKLTNPKNAALTMKDAVHLSRAIASMKQSRAQCTQCAHLYREGEIQRLMRRVDQLDKELPLQTMRTLVPYENTLGGFEMFNTGVTDLAPELIGWYGAPGVNLINTKCGCYQGCNLSQGGCSTGEECSKLQADVDKLTAAVATLATNEAKTTTLPIPACEGEGTTLFLVGNNFSVHDTKVIAGGVCIPHVQLISRELMRVTIPSCINTVTLCEYGENRPYVAVYVATPYGVTNHLHVPAVSQGLAAETKDQIEAITAAKFAAEVKTLKIPQSDIAVTPASTGRKTLLIQATRDPALANDVVLYPPTGADVPEVEFAYSAAIDPEFADKAVTVYGAAQHKGQFLGELFRVTHQDQYQNLAQFAAISSDADNSTASLLSQLSDPVTYQTLVDGNGKQAFKLVYYVRVDGSPVPVRVFDEIDIEVQLVDSPPAAVEKAVEQLPPGTEARQPANPQSTAGTMPRGWEPVTQSRNLAGVPVMYASQQTVPAQFAQFEQPIGQPISTDLPVGSVPANSSTELVPGAGLGGATPVIQPVPPLPAQALPQSVPMVVPNVQVNIAQPVIVPARDHKWWDDKKHPVVNRMKTEARECWHNVRDQLPGN